MINGSRGPMLRQATALDWVGDPFDTTGFVALHGESTYAQFLEHYREYTDVAGDHFLNLVATTLPTNAFLVTGDAKYRRWIVEYMDAWLARMNRTPASSPASSTSMARSGDRDTKWWGNAYGWGFSPINPVTGRRENRNRIPRALVGFSNALLVTGDQKYVDAWRAMIAAVNSHARVVDGRTRVSDDVRRRWLVRLAARTVERRRARGVVLVDALRPIALAWAQTPGSTFSREKIPAIPRPPSSARSRASRAKLATIRADRTPPDKRLADNMLDSNPAATDALVRLMWGALVPGREGGLLNARLRYFDPARRRAGVPEDVAALVSELDDRRTVVTLVNLSATRIAHGHRPGGRLRRAPVRIRRVERTAPAGREGLHRAARAGRGREAHARDTPLCQSADSHFSLGAVRARHCWFGSWFRVHGSGFWVQGSGFTKFER